MIPKIIHYCWFGGKEVPQSTKKNIESWKKFLPGYEIKRWDESNFEVNAIKYTREAYAADTTPIHRQISCNNQNDKKTRVNTNIYSIWQMFNKVCILLFVCYFTILFYYLS